MLTRSGRLVVGALALVVAGFALGSIMRLGLSTEHALALLGGAATLLVVAARERGDRR